MASKYYNLEKVKPSGIELKERLVGIQRVTKVTKGGRTFSFSAIMVVGDEAGVVGHGMGKAQEVVSAITKATEDAKKNLYLEIRLEKFLMNMPKLLIIMVLINLE